MNKYRDNGAIGALLDEYEKAINELKSLIKPLDNDTIATIIDNKTNDADCRSIQTILSHVVASGYTYVVYLRRGLGESVDFRQKQKLDTAQEYIDALNKMFKFNEAFFRDYPDYDLEEYNIEKKILTRWGQRYDGDQIIEHAIVHILRHRRQIERFLLKLNQ